MPRHTSPRTAPRPLALCLSLSLPFSLLLLLSFTRSIFESRFLLVRFRSLLWTGDDARTRQLHAILPCHSIVFSLPFSSLLFSLRSPFITRCVSIVRRGVVCDIWPITARRVNYVDRFIRGTYRLIGKDESSEELSSSYRVWSIKLPGTKWRK